MPFNLNDLSTASNFISAWGLVFLAALWASLIFWTYRDAKARLKEPLPRVLAVLIVVVLFVPGVLVYMIVRPPRTIEEEYLVTLEEEALLRAIEENEQS